jgi:hypothetical protein
VTNDLEAENKRLWKFVEMLEHYTENWDQLCNCGNHGSHHEDCDTVSLRKDCHFAMYGVKLE